MALAFSSPAAAARSLLHGVGSAAASGGRDLLVGSAPSGRKVVLAVAVPLPGDGGAKAPTRLRCAAGDHASPSDEDKAFRDGVDNHGPSEDVQEFLDGVDNHEAPSDEDKAFLEAMEYARAKIQVVFSAGDKTVLERLATAAKNSLGVLDSILRDQELPLPDALHQEVVRIATAFVEVQAQSEGGYASADTVLAAMYGLQRLSCIFTGDGVEVPLMLRYFTGDLSVEEDIRQGTFRITYKLYKLGYRYYDHHITSPAARSVVRYNCPAILVENEKDILDRLRTTARDSQALLAEMLAKDRAFPLTNLVRQELVRIGTLFIKLEKECTEGYAATGSLVAAMDGLKKTTEILAGRAAAQTLSPYNFSYVRAIQNKVSFMSDLADAFAVYLTDARLRCSGV